MIPEYSSFEFKTFINKYNIKHITPSPRYPQSNGFAERTGQTAKNLLKKAKEDKQDVEISLLELRNTPLKNLGHSPAEILMGCKTRSWLPIKKSVLNPTQDIHRSIKDNFKKSQQQQKHYYDKTSKNLQKIDENEHVRMRDDGKQWIPAKCIATEDNIEPRSYLLQCKVTFVAIVATNFQIPDISNKTQNIETRIDNEVSNFHNSSHSNQEQKNNGDVSDHINVKDESDMIVSKFESQDGFLNLNHMLVLCYLLIIRTYNTLDIDVPVLADDIRRETKKNKVLNRVSDFVLNGGLRKISWVKKQFDHFTEDGISYQ
ncbi:hypothetical protein GQR58_024763 [Nymphon striatum]|nr:hypothetical protein GQR58_024763 [Nymphon striatum]